MKIWLRFLVPHLAEGNQERGFELWLQKKQWLPRPPLPWHVDSLRVLIKKLKSYILISKSQTRRDPKTFLYSRCKPPKLQRYVIDLCQGFTVYAWPRGPANLFGSASKVFLEKWIQWLSASVFLFSSAFPIPLCSSPDEAHIHLTHPLPLGIWVCYLWTVQDYSELVLRYI